MPCISQVIQFVKGRGADPGIMLMLTHILIYSLITVIIWLCFAAGMGLLFETLAGRGL